MERSQRAIREQHNTEASGRRTITAGATGGIKKRRGGGGPRNPQASNPGPTGPRSIDDIPDPQLKEKVRILMASGQSYEEARNNVMNQLIFNKDNRARSSDSQVIPRLRRQMRQRWRWQAPQTAPGKFGGGLRTPLELRGAEVVREVLQAEKNREK